MADIRITVLPLLTDADPANDPLLIEDVSTDTTKKITPSLLKTSMSLGNVDNTSDLSKPISTAVQTALNAKQNTLTLTTTGTSGPATLVGSALNIPQYTGGASAGVSSLEGLTGDLDLIAGAGISITNNGTDQITITNTGGGGGSVAWGGITGTLSNQTDLQSSLDGKEATITAGTTAQYYRGDKSFQTLDKTAVGLSNVDNTSDANKPVSTATQTALDGKQDTLVSGTNIKTINSTSILGSGDIAISASPSGGAGAIQFSDGSAFASDATNLFWDDTNNRLGVGTNVPSHALTIDANTTDDGLIMRGPTDTVIFQITKDGNTLNSSELFQYNAGVINFALRSPGNASYFNNGTFTFGANTNLGAKVNIKGSGSTSATTALLVQNSAGVDMMKITDDIVTTIGNQFNIIRTNVPAQSVEINANFSTIAAGIRAGGNGKDFVISAKESRDLYLSTNFSSTITQVQFAVKHNTGVLIKDNASTTMDASARLEVTSTTQGFLPPRMTTTQKNAISSPAAGLVVYDNTVNRASVYSTAWENVITEVNGSPNSVANIWSGSQAQYNALTPSSSTLYFIV